ncbi:hypothetical protein [Belnapia rosea]|uniref:Uncharacterized protein n=1 Tax=Belnapia rosea TaxID=938405 RepID=A0A1G6R260_9PROT|nr:hypothetical protein [Belnapia rosea]SDB73273.1 hypothetical protein SAMN02927895_04708 [Belnapia rosea]SDC98729.1 hypothetical protein SAMN04487779_1003280 [Belnapia rosea]
MTRPPRPAKPKGARGQGRRLVQLEAELAETRAKLARAEASLQEFEKGGVEAYAARRIAVLEEGQQVARGQAVEAAIAKSRAEGELKALRDAIGKVPGFHGWLLRKAVKKLDGQ